MAAFDFVNRGGAREGSLHPANPLHPTNPPAHQPPVEEGLVEAIPDPRRRLREESIITMKIYDSCRHRNCLTYDDIGCARHGHRDADMARAADDAAGLNECISVPDDATSVTARDLRVISIDIISKEPCPFRRGYYNVELKYNFEYTLVFKRPDGSIICEENAVSTHSCRQTLFGSIGTEATISTDLFAEHLGGPMTFSSDPYIMVEAKAVALGAEIRRGCSHNPDGSHRPRTVGVTIGLFGIIKLYRIVSLLVESRGFSIAPECDGCAPPNACDFFDTIDFPMDAFSPPQKPEFTGGISENIPRTVSE